MKSDFYCDEVLSGKTIVQVVKETEFVLAFHHTRPSYPVHVVVIPKQHYPSFTSVVPDSVMLELVSVIREVARGIEAAEGACRIVTNLGDYQDSGHLHFHVISGKFIPNTAP